MPTKQVAWTLPFAGVRGGSSADKVADNIAVGELSLKIDPYFLRDGFAVMSVGKHCREDKMDFVWFCSRGLPPYLVRQDGSIVVLSVRG